MDDFRIAVVSTFLVGGTLWLASPIERLPGNTGINIATRQDSGNITLVAFA